MGQSKKYDHSGGPVVSVLVFHSNEPSSNSGDVYSFSVKSCSIRAKII